MKIFMNYFKSLIELQQLIDGQTMKKLLLINVLGNMALIFFRKCKNSIWGTIEKQYSD